MPYTPNLYDDDEMMRKKKRTPYDTMTDTSSPTGPIGAPASGGVDFSANIESPVAATTKPQGDTMAGAYKAQVDKQFAAQEKQRERADMTPIERRSAANQDRMQRKARQADKEFEADTQANDRANLKGDQYNRVGGSVGEARQNAIDKQGEKMTNRAYDYLKKRRANMAAQGGKKKKDEEEMPA